MSRSEADTRAKLIDPAIHKRGWTEALLPINKRVARMFLVSKSLKPIFVGGEAEFTAYDYRSHASILSAASLSIGGNKLDHTLNMHIVKDA